MPQHTHIRIQKSIHTILRARLLPTRQRTPRDFITRHAFRPANVGEVVNGCRTRALATLPSKHRAAEGESRKGFGGKKKLQGGHTFLDLSLLHFVLQRLLEVALFGVGEAVDLGLRDRLRVHGYELSWR